MMHRVVPEKPVDKRNTLGLPAPSSPMLGRTIRLFRPYRFQVVAVSVLILLTASIGVADAVVTQAEDWTALYGQADRALYRAKDEGRDRVEAFEKDAAAQARTPSRPARQA